MSIWFLVHKLCIVCELYDQSNEQRAISPKNRIGTVDVSFPSIEKFDFLPEPRVEGYKAFVSIMEGCSKYCSFCVVPYTRGEELSRPLDDVLAEIDSLAAQGVREINLLGQNVNGYRGEKDDGSICRFAELLHYVSHVDGVERIRYTTSHPLEFTDDIIDAYAQLRAGVALASTGSKWLKRYLGGDETQPYYRCLYQSDQ